MRVFIFIITLFSALPAAAASLRQVDNPACFAALEGVIETGDFARISAALAENRPQDGVNDDGHYFIPNRAVCLNSPGGSLPEAIQLAEYFFDNQYGTVVDDDAQCLSACSIIFMMGTEDYADYNIVDRKLHVNGTLGFHRPAFSAPDRDGYSARELEKSFEIAIDATLLFTQLASRSVRRGTGPMINIGLMEQMFSHHGQDFYYIDTIDKAGRWDIALTGFEIPKEISLRDAQTACDNAINWTMGLESSGTGHLSSPYEAFWNARIGKPRSDTVDPMFQVYSRANLHSVIPCVVDYSQNAAQYSEEGDWVHICGANEEFCSLTENELNNLRGFRPEVILPSALKLKQVPAQMAAISAEAGELNKAWGRSDPSQCLLAKDTKVSVVNVSEFVNLRERPGFDAAVVGTAGRYLMLEVTEKGAFLNNNPDNPPNCGPICKTVGDGYGNATEDDISALKQCLNANAIWYKVRIPDGAEGFVSGKYLR